MEDRSLDIVKSNALIEALYNPSSVYHLRLLMAALMQIKSKNILDFRTRYYVSANALADMTGSKAKNNYKELKRAADQLMDSTLTVKDSPDGKPLSKYLRMNLVSSCEYEEGIVGLRFTEEVIPYISSLKNRFTQYQAKYVMPMRSGYGIRLYELCLQWLGDEREFSVEDFRQVFDLRNKYPLIADLKKRVIEPAIKDINEFSDIDIEFGQRKKGRKITHFQFKITRKKKGRKETQTELALDHPPSIINNSVLDRYIADNPESTRGKTVQDVIKMIKTTYPTAKVAIDY